MGTKPEGNSPTIERGTDREETIPPDRVSLHPVTLPSPYGLNIQPKGNRIGTIENRPPKIGNTVIRKYLRDHPGKRDGREDGDL